MQSMSSISNRISGVSTFQEAGLEGFHCSSFEQSEVCQDHMVCLTLISLPIQQMQGTFVSNTVNAKMDVCVIIQE